MDEDTRNAIKRRETRIEELEAIQKSEKKPTPQRTEQLTRQIEDEKAVVSEMKRAS